MRIPALLTIQNDGLDHEGELAVNVKLDHPRDRLFKADWSQATFRTALSKPAIRNRGQMPTFRKTIVLLEGSRSQGALEPR